MNYNQIATPIENEQWGWQLCEFSRFQVALAAVRSTLSA
jgi:hypothetical protein